MPNVVVGSNWTQRDIEIIFEHEDVIFADETELSVLLKDLGVYKSTSEARRANRVGPVPTGYTEFKASKKHMLFIWNPTE